MTTEAMNYPGRYLALRLPPVCVAVAAENPTDLLDRVEDVAHANPFVELRLDYLPNPAAAFPKLRQMLHSHMDLRVIATCRRATVGGRFRGSVASQVDVLAKAVAAGCHLVDLELESAAAMKAVELDKLRRQAPVIISVHDFRGTRKLAETFTRMKAFPADAYKLISTAHSLMDNVTMLEFVREASREHSVIGFCMGEQGQLSRILALRTGSTFIYASAERGEESAPGQITYRDLRDIYRLDRVDAATRVYGVAGDPISHSLSPLMLNSAFRRENSNAVYVALPTKDLDDLVQCVKRVPIHGLSVTMPYKEQILDHLDNSDAVTTRVGACNTVVRSQDGRLYGFNTDLAGIIRPLEQRMNLSGARVLVIGAGGAGRAAVFGLKERGADVSITSRTPASAHKLARQAHAKCVLKSALKKLNFDVIINASSSGMTGKRDESPLAAEEINARFLMELIYAPPETRLMRLARGRGVQIISGSEVFVQQGARQFEIWTGKPAPVEEMTRVVQQVLGPVLQPEKPVAVKAAPAAAKAQPASAETSPAKIAGKNGNAKPPATTAAKSAIPAAKPATPAGKPATPAAKPPATTAAKPAIPAAKLAAPAAKPAVKAVAKPAAKPVAKPAAKPVAKPAAKPVAKPAAKAVPKPAAKAVPKRAAQAKPAPRKAASKNGRKPARPATRK